MIWKIWILPVGKTAKILKQVFRAFNGLLNIDYPLFGIKGFFKLLQSFWPFRGRIAAMSPGV
jgi:hypothetical protein